LPANEAEPIAAGRAPGAELVAGLAVLIGLLLVLYVVGTWWSATGLILFLGRLHTRTFAWSLGIASLLLLPGGLMLFWSTHETSIRGACVGFAATLVIWGWLELSFLLGMVTGPRRGACSAGCRGFPHFIHALEAILYHELATLAAAGLIVMLSWHAANQTALWTFMMLWGMRISAKLNLFFGVRNTGEIMLPQQLKYLGTFFGQRKVSRLFPVSVTLASLLCGSLVVIAYSAPSWDFVASEVALLATLAALATLEHWMLILPMRADAPWRIMRVEGMSTAHESAAVPVYPTAKRP
jgi:putative photosynthetic complex assembly protein 2